MTRFTSIAAVAAVLTLSTAAFAGEPTGRYQGAVGSLPEGVEQVYVAHNGGQRGVTAAYAENIPAGQINGHAFALLQNHGRAYTVTAFSIPNDATLDVMFANAAK